jgi:hypothetical protein
MGRELWVGMFHSLEIDGGHFAGRHGPSQLRERLWQHLNRSGLRNASLFQEAEKIGKSVQARNIFLLL